MSDKSTSILPEHDTSFIEHEKPVELENYDEELRTEEDIAFGYERKEAIINEEEDMRRQAFGDW